VLLALLGPTSHLPQHYGRTDNRQTNTSSEQKFLAGLFFGAVAEEFGTQDHRRQLVRGLPFRNKADAGKTSLIWGPQALIRPQCRVNTPLWAPSADSGQRKKMIPVNERYNLVEWPGLSTSVLRDSSVYSQKWLSQEFDSQRHKNKTDRRDFPVLSSVQSPD
jgi:hypothetical protein